MADETKRDAQETLHRAHSAAKQVVDALDDAEVALNGGRMSEAADLLLYAEETASRVGFRIGDVRAKVRAIRDTRGGDRG